MKPLIVLLSTFTLVILTIKLFTKEYNFSLAARIALAVMLCFTALGHFLFTKGMTMMIPPMIPFKTSLVYLTGIFEVLLAVGLLIPKTQKLSGWLLILFLLLMLPANIYAAVNQINYQKGTYNGNGLSYLWFRIPLQVLFIVWAFLCSIKIYK